MPTRYTPSWEAGKRPRYRPGPICSSSTTERCLSGDTTPTWESRKLMNSPLPSMASTTTSPVSSTRETVATVSLREPVRSVQRVT